MDVYKSVVLKGGQAAWHALTCMGRPLWASTLTPKRSGKGNLPARTSSDLVSLAANKLMLGLPPGEKSYTEVTMFGVASMLCRLGVRPYSTSASRTVADFMAVLAYVSHERDGCLSSYASDPVLALGAMRVWYAETNALADHILPQLKKLMLDEVLDTGGVGEMVARILMLLAMDKCVMKGRPILECELTGQFVSVASFLRVLDVGEDTPVLVKGMARADDEVREAFLKWQQQWGRWEMGFNHFIQLELEPNESTLWQLLGRRAAGIFPRNQHGADLVIPIFRRKTSIATDEHENESKTHVETSSEAAEAGSEGGEVSMILIQVENRHPEDSTFFTSATKKLCPSFVFGERSSSSGEGAGGEAGGNPPAKPSLEEVDKENSLRKKPVREVIRIYMNLRGQNHVKFIYATSLEDNSPDRPVASDGSGTAASSCSSEIPPSGVTTAARCASELAAKRGSTRTSGLKDSNATKQKVVTKCRKEKVSVKKLSKPIFTICFRTICPKSYPFVDKEVASKLNSMVGSLWKPMEVVKGDLQHREMKSKFNETLSKAMPRKELEEIAYHGLAHVRGHGKRSKNQTSTEQQPSRAVQETSKATSKRVRDGEQGGSPTKRRATGS